MYKLFLGALVLSGASFAHAQSAPPTISVAPVSIVEGNQGLKNATFRVTLSPPSKTPLQVRYSTSDGTAKAGEDYVATSGTITIKAGARTGAFSVPVFGDTKVETDEKFAVNIVAPGYTTPSPAAYATIVNDDREPLTIFAQNVSTREGNSGRKDAIFKVTLSQASPSPLRVYFFTSDQTAKAGEDYVSKSASFVIPANQRTGSFAVPIIGDTTIEEDETFAVRLTAKDYTQFSAPAIGTILNDDMGATPRPVPSATPVPTPSAKGKIAYISYPRDTNAEIYIMNADGSNQTRLTNDDNEDHSPALSKDGQKIAFIKDGPGYTDLFSMNADGTDVQRLTTDTVGEATPAFSPDNSKIAFVSYQNNRQAVYSINADGTDRQQLADTGGICWSPQYSPDGSKIVFFAAPSGPSSDYDIYLMNADGTDLQQLTTNGQFKRNSNPQFTSDGQGIVFVAQTSNYPQLFRMDLDGTNVKQLSLGGDRNISSLSPDNRAFAYTAGSNVGNVFVANLDGTGAKRLTNTNGAGPSWSVGSVPSPAQPSTLGKIAFASRRDGDMEIYIVNADGTNETRLTNAPSDDMYPDLSADGSKIVFMSARDDSNTFEIYSMNADGTDQKRLTNNKAYDAYPVFSPDGSKIAFTSTRSGNNVIYVMNADGTNQVPLTSAGENNLYPSFSPDGSQIAFWHFFGGEYFGLMNADGSNQKFSYAPFGPNSSWSPDGKRIAFDSLTDPGPYINSINPDGTQPKALTNDKNTYSHPSYAPDSASITFSSDRNGGNSTDISAFDIYTMKIGGTGPKRITTKGGFGPSWGPGYVPVPQTTKAAPATTPNSFKSSSAPTS